MTNRDLFISGLQDSLSKTLEMPVNKALTKKIANDVVEQIIAYTLAFGEVSFPQRLKFVLSERKERTQINPRTKEKITVPHKYVLKVKPLKAIKELLELKSKKETQ